MTTLPVKSRLARQVYWNLLALVLPLGLALAAYPVLHDLLGLDRLGVLMLSWLAIGYSAIIDLGLPRALTRRLAASSRRTPVIPWEVQVTAVAAAMFVVGAVLGGAVVGASDMIAARGMQMPSELVEEGASCVRATAWSFPAILLCRVVQAVLEASGDFRRLAVMRGTNALVAFGLPVLSASFIADVGVAGWALCVGRWVVMGWFFCSLRFRGRLFSMMRGQYQSVLLDILHTGKWMALTGVAATLMLYSDRFLIPRMQSLGALAAYQMSSEVIRKTGVVSVAFGGVVYPTIAHGLQNAESKSKGIFHASGGIVLVTSAIIAAAFILFGPLGLEVWAGHEVATISTPIIPMMAIGAFAQAASTVPYNTAHALGLEKDVALAHLLMTPFVITGAYLLIDGMGLRGAALAWCFRACIDAALMLRIVAKCGLAWRAEAAKLLKETVILILVLVVVTLVS